MHDVIVVGGSYAGISAALQIARGRRRVLVIDAGVRRNRFVKSAHGFLGQDGRDPAEIAAAGRAELLLYPNVSWLDGSASDARVSADGFTVTLASGECHAGRRLVLASGVTDELPDIPGVSERWGRSIFHCPYCHGYELGQGRIGVLGTSPLSVHSALMLPDWGETTYFTRGLFAPSEEEHAALKRRGVKLEDAAIAAIEGEAHEPSVRLTNGATLSFAGLFLLPKMLITSPLATRLGCAIEDGPLGKYLHTDAMKETSVPGVFACGDLALPMGSLAFAVGDGARAGVAAHQSLIFR
jgi:thioredoxin reductase